ncbi:MULTISPECIES: undecaprenyl-diphosphatase [unclassified Bartonella]|uniref:undecaprenyl-diphosphatase n=1 Tax=unclassified Bartonella TaxID=2645622 RepID=UPI0009994072|nr:MULTISPECIES: undecaprenyl-diphosphatase [unclassified Bartonella]AQX27807.1 undecaprenyl-diphosphatase [Bartonella sp. JB15]AQX29089.1 undecaprenyl-diphosphatase [Bartonella sp. JB63]
MNFLHQIDVVLFEMLANNHQTWLALIWFGIICAKFLIYIIPIHLCVLWFCGRYTGRCVVLSICVSICVTLFVGYLISLIYYRPRPFVAGLIKPLIKHRETASFPSNHALIIVSYFVNLYLYRCKIASKFALIFLLLICWGRVFTGVHYPLDVLAGVFLGSFISWFIIRFVASYFPKFLYQIPPLKYNFHIGIHSK